MNNLKFEFLVDNYDNLYLNFIANIVDINKVSSLQLNTKIEERHSLDHKLILTQFRLVN